MNESSNGKACLEAVGSVLIRSFLIGLVFLLLWFLMFAVASDWVYSIHSRWFDIPRQTFNAIHYAGMAALKGVLLMVFLVPYIAIRLTCGKSGK